MNFFKKKSKLPGTPAAVEKLVLSYNDVEKSCQTILREMHSVNFMPDYVVGITRGGLLPAVLISQYLEVPMYALKVTLRDGIEQDCDHNCWMPEDALGSETNPINILIVDDINDSGATIKWIKDDWQSGCLPDDPRWNQVWHNNVKFATVVHNLSSTQEVDFWNIEVNKAEKDVWVEFPYEEWWAR